MVLLVAALILVCGCRHTTRALYPLGIYGVPDTNALAAVQQAGFNMVVGVADEKYLDAADRLGLKVIASPGTTAGKDFSGIRARQIIRQFDHHPALWAWYLADEPDLNQVNPDDVRKAVRVVKSTAARKPTALVLYQGAEALNYANIADITMIDRYPIPWLPLANFPQHVRMARLALGKDKPLIAVIQAFDWSCFPNLLPGKTNLRPPSQAELRCMSYCALARRATGLSFYCYDDGAWRMRDHPQTWEALQTVAAEIKDRTPLFQAEHLWWTYHHEYPDSSGFNSALESSILPALLRVRRGNWAVPEGDYLLTVNTTDRHLVYRIQSTLLGSEELPVLGEARRIVLTDATLEDKFGPFDIHIYGPIRKSAVVNR